MLIRTWLSINCEKIWTKLSGSANCETIWKNTFRFYKLCLESHQNAPLCTKERLSRVRFNPGLSWHWLSSTNFLDMDYQCQPFVTLTFIDYCHLWLLSTFLTTFIDFSTTIILCLNHHPNRWLQHHNQEQGHNILPWFLSASLFCHESLTTIQIVFQTQVLTIPYVTNVCSAICHGNTSPVTMLMTMLMIMWQLTRHMWRWWWPLTMLMIMWWLIP